MMTIRKIKFFISSLFGKKIKIIYYGNRNKKEVYIGYILKLYYNVFTIKLLNDDVKSFSYIDVLTKTIKIMY